MYAHTLNIHSLQPRALPADILFHATQACDSALEKAESYNHSQTEQWNNAIIVRPST